jgi:CrcB protein
LRGIEFALLVLGAIDERQLSLVAMNILANVGLSIGTVMGGRLLTNLIVPVAVRGGDS